MGDDSSLPEPFARRLARVDIPVLTSGRGRETSPGRSLYGWAKFRLRTFSKNPPNSRTKGAECGLEGDCALSIRDDEAEEAWRVITPILDVWAQGWVPLLEYPAGSDGPTAATYPPGGQQSGRHRPGYGPRPGV